MKELKIKRNINSTKETSLKADELKSIVVKARR